ncbi:hypothetical protein LTR53_017259 [Teratosphaeriaceae sp. CCFEE 6253]|nr:hypothetical protein LTR53_017259 [Teratosphaeriaceae sp. CCFEE 6253]
MLPLRVSPSKASIDSVLDAAKPPSGPLSNTSTPATSTAPALDPTPPQAAPAAIVPTAPPAASGPTWDSPPALPPPPSAVAQTAIAPSPPVASPPAPVQASPSNPAASPAPASTDPPAAATPAPGYSLAAPQLIAPLLTRLGAALKPFWIGPPRKTAPARTMKSPATVEYASKGLQPPVYVFTNLSDPAWEAVELDHEKQADGENRFYKTFTVDEGEYQYKLRLGPGDWWALDDGMPSVDDGIGNKNNVMVVKATTAGQAAPPPKDLPVKAADVPAPQTPAALPQPSPPQPAPPATVSQPAPMIALSQPQEPSQLPTVLAPPAAPTPSRVGEKTAPITSKPITPARAPATPPMAPLMKHESFYPELDDLDQNGYLDNEDEVFEHMQNPLLRHETLGPDADEHLISPLLRHETMALGEHFDEPDHTYAGSALSITSSGSSAADAISPEADLNDASLESFLTDRDGIHQHIQRASTHLPADEVLAGNHAGSPSSAGKERPQSPTTSLPGVQEEEEEEVAEDDEEDIGPATHPHPHHHHHRHAHFKFHEPAQAEDVDPLTPAMPRLVVTEPPAQQCDALITPPMTPQEAEKIVEHLVDVAESKGIAEGIVMDEIAHQQQEVEKEAVLQATQESGSFGPTALIAFAGLALAIVVGVWKVRYAS